MARDADPQRRDAGIVEDVHHGAADAAPKWHAATVADVADSLDTSPEGLSSIEVGDRLARYGPNRLPDEPPPHPLTVFARQFADPLIVILLVAAGITLVIGELLDTALIAAALLLNAIIGFTQERRAVGAVRALMNLVVPRSRVVRDGRDRVVDSPELVPGDVVVLEPGTRVPADIRIMTASALRIDESLLTGESLPVTKRTDPVGAGADLADRRSMAYTGTIVTSGRGRGYVVTTGANTELGEIAGMMSVQDPTESPLHIAMSSFARIIVVSVLIAAVVTFVSGLALGGTAEQMFHTAVAMAVSAVPEGLPVAVTVTLAIGVSRMARRRAVLRRLPALEALGSTTVIGSDKTGTLTENRMVVQAVWADGRRYSIPSDVPPAPPDVFAADTRAEPVHIALAIGALTNNAGLARTPGDTTPTGDPTEVALLAAAGASGIDPDDLRARHRRLVDIPFDADRRHSATVRVINGDPVIFVKGAPERVINMCTTIVTPDGPQSIDVDTAHRAAVELAGDGLRVLALAYRRVSNDDVLTLADGDAGDPDELVLAGFQAMIDPPRDSVAEAVADCRTAGVRVVMITGDHAATARAIAARLGIIDSPSAPVATGADVADLEPGALRQVVADVSVFARVSPEGKLRIVRALQSLGHVVAVTGDGVNDAPALRAAEIGVAMGRGGTDVAREASDMVLSDDNFVSIVSAVEEGRVAFSNIRKVSFFLISTALAETLAIMVSVWLGWPLLLVPAQILWLNLVTNGVQDLALAFEPGSPDVLRRPPRPRREGILSPMMWERTALVGVVMTVGALTMFRWELDRSGSLMAAQSVALTTLVVFNVFQAGNARSENRSIFTLHPWANPFLFWASIGAVGLYVAALYLPPTQYILRIEPISLTAWLQAILVASSALVVVEIHKAIRRRWPRRGHRPEQDPLPTNASNSP